MYFITRDKVREAFRALRAEGYNDPKFEAVLEKLRRGSKSTLAKYWSATTPRQSSSGYRRRCAGFQPYRRVYAHCTGHESVGHCARTGGDHAHAETVRGPRALSGCPGSLRDESHSTASP